MTRGARMPDPLRTLAGRNIANFELFSLAYLCTSSYEFWKKQLIEAVGVENAPAYRTPIYLTAAALAEFVADIALCPLEATRIRLVSQPDFAPSMLSAFARLAKEEGLIKGFYSGFGTCSFVNFLLPISSACPLFFSSWLRATVYMIYTDFFPSLSLFFDRILPVGSYQAPSCSSRFPTPRVSSSCTSLRPRPSSSPLESPRASLPTRPSLT
jgi:hypothetical protein